MSKAIIVYDLFIEGQIVAIEPVIDGAPLGMLNDERENGVDFESMLKAMQEVLRAASKYAANPSHDAASELFAAADLLNKEEQKF